MSGTGPLNLTAAKAAVGTSDEFDGMRGYWRGRALSALLDVWQPSLVRCARREYAAQVLRRATREQLKAEMKEEYGSVVIAIIIAAVISTAISWLVERLLNLFWPPKPSQVFGGDVEFIKAMNRLSGKAE